MPAFGGKVHGRSFPHYVLVGGQWLKVFSEFLAKLPRTSDSFADVAAEHAELMQGFPVLAQRETTRTILRRIC